MVDKVHFIYFDGFLVHNDDNRLGVGVILLSLSLSYRPDLFIVEKMNLFICNKLVVKAIDYLFCLVKLVRNKFTTPILRIKYN